MSEYQKVFLLLLALPKKHFERLMIEFELRDLL